MKHPPMKYPVAVKSMGWARPSQEVLNTDSPFKELLEQNLVSSVWFRFWGIEKRALMDRALNVAKDFSLAACREALKNGDTQAEDIDLILTSLPSPIHRDQPGDIGKIVPRIGNTIRDELGAKNCVSWDVEMECLSFVLLMQLAVNFIQTGNYKRVLICATETLSESLDFCSPLSSVFGDGSVAALITAEDNGGALLASSYGASGEFYDVATMRWRWPTDGLEGDIPKKRTDFSTYFTLAENGRERMADFVPKTLPIVIRNVLDDSDLSVDNIDKVVFHQPGKVLVDGWANAVAAECGSIDGKYPITLTNNGCLGSCALPTTLLSSIHDGTIKAGDHVILAGLGIGWVYTAQLWQWGDTRVSITTV
jgi:3-oxoacyl-[acyl-carrier-protein] synthase-3